MKKITDLTSLKNELLHANFDLDAHLLKESQLNSPKIIENKHLDKISGALYEQTNPDGSKTTVFLKGGPISF